VKTRDLIAALSADVAGAPVFSRILSGAIAIACGAAIIGFVVTLGPRADLADAAGTWRFLFKLAVVLTLVVTALPLLWSAGRPDADPGRRSLLPLVAPVLLVAGVGVEFLLLAPAEWRTVAVGSNALLCLSAIPLLSIAPLVILLLALKGSAPVRPGMAGACAGLVSASVAAALYALHCFDDSPLFVVIWYSLGIGVVTLVAALAGLRFLRW